MKKVGDWSLIKFHPLRINEWILKVDLQKIHNLCHSKISHFRKKTMPISNPQLQAWLPSHLWEQIRGRRGPERKPVLKIFTHKSLFEKFLVVYEQKRQKGQRKMKTIDWMVWMSIECYSDSVHYNVFSFTFLVEMIHFLPRKSSKNRESLWL